MGSGMFGANQRTVSHSLGEPAIRRMRDWVLDAVHETIRVKSAAWDDNSVLIYTTLNHIKYCLPNGDSGIIRTLDVPVYIAKVFGNIIYCLDRDGKNRQIQVRPGACMQHGRPQGPHEAVP